MIPILFAKTETQFNNNGLGRLDECLSCEVTEERNGIYECEFTYPINGRHYSDIEIGCIIYCTHDETKLPQPFDIYKKTVSIDGIATYNAHHISYRLNHVILNPFTAGTCAEAFSKIRQNSVTTNNFYFNTDKVVTANFAVKHPASVRQILGGETGSILDIFETGEYKFDKFNVYFYLHRGTDTNAEIRYGKNLTDFTNELDSENVYNAVAPYWYNEETGELVTLTEKVIQYGSGDVVAVPLDLTEEFENAPTESELRAKATSRLNNSEAWEPNNNFEIDFIQLWQTPEYENFAVLQRLKLCDTVKIIFPAAGFDARAKIISVTYDSLNDRYTKMELGSPRQSFADTVKADVSSAVLATVPSFSMMAGAISHATELITGGTGGCVVINRDASGKPFENLILDTDSIETAVNVWRWNSGGLGHSSNGYEGPYTDLALTMDGQINADLITTGTLSANRILGGTIQSTAEDGVSFWNLATGAFVTGDSERSLRITNGYLYVYSPEKTSYVGRIGTFYWDNVHSSANSGFGIYTNSTNLTLGFVDETGSNITALSINNGLNPNDITQRIIFWGSCNFRNPAVFTSTASFQSTSTFSGNSTFTSAAIFNSYLRFIGNDSTKYGYISGFNDGSGFAINTGGADRFILRAGTTNVLAIDNGAYNNAGTAKYFPGKFYFKDAVIEQNTYTGGVASIRLATERLIVGNYSVMSGYKCRFESVYIDGALSAQSVTNRSDEHQKNIEAWNDEYTALIDDLEPIVFTWKDGEDQKQHVGLGARHTKALLEKHGLEDSGFVHVSDDDEYSIAYNELTVMLLKRVQEQQETINNLLTRIEALEGVAYERQ